MILAFDDRSFQHSGRIHRGKNAKHLWNELYGGDCELGHINVLDVQQIGAWVDPDTNSRLPAPLAMPPLDAYAATGAKHREAAMTHDDASGGRPPYHKFSYKSS